MMKTILKIVLPLVVLALAVVGSIAMYNARPEVETQRPEILPPLVHVQEVTKQALQLTVKSQGTVSPRTESQLVPEVSGRVVWVSPKLVSGGFFEEGEVLLRIDSLMYKQAVIRARAEVSQRKLRLAQEEAEAAVARKEWKDLGEGEASPLTLREPQLEDARASQAAAEAALEQAQYDLERTEIKAPYAGRVRQKSVDVGQFVPVGSPMATIYAVDFAEIRLPLPDCDLAFLMLPLVYREDTEGDHSPPVLLRAHFAGKEHTWEGRIVRTEGEIDPVSRMVHAVARVKNPYGRGENPDRPPLGVGLYVGAEIQGLRVEDVVVLQRAALRGTNRVWVVDQGGTLRFRDVVILRTTRDEIIVESGLEAGELVCLSPLGAVTDGMKVRIPDPEQEASAAAVVEGRDS